MNNDRMNMGEPGSNCVDRRRPRIIRRGWGTFHVLHCVFTVLLLAGASVMLADCLSQRARIRAIKDEYIAYGRDIERHMNEAIRTRNPVTAMNELEHAFWYWRSAHPTATEATKELIEMFQRTAEMTPQE